MRTTEALRQPTVPAVPSTPAQHGRYGRILVTATTLLALGGEDLLQMKELAQRAEVSLATLYRYFPAKEYVLLAIAVNRYESALRRVADEVPDGVTAQERVVNHLLREFRAGQRDQKLSASLVRVLADTRADYRQVIEQVRDLHVKILQQVAVAGRPLSREEYRRLMIVHDVFGAAQQRWLAGVCSAAEARFEIRLGGHLLNVPGLFAEVDQVPAAAGRPSARAARSR
jgi:TetR/AcrR family transcriptional regulator, cholesterol catabolism regulator